MEDERLYELVRQQFYAEAFEGLLDRYRDKVYRARRALADAMKAKGAH